MSDWRQDPATRAQKERLRKEGIKFQRNVTKGEASDLIGNTVGADDEQLEALRFFKIAGAKSMSQTEARRATDQVFADPANVTKWQNRPATKTQKSIYQFFGIDIPRGLKHRQAQQFVDALFEDESKLDAWQDHENAQEDRESWFEDALELINDDRDLYDCKKISKKLFRQVTEALESDGMTLEQIEENTEAFFQKALDLNPNLRRAPTTDGRRAAPQERGRQGGSGCLWRVVKLAAVAAIVVWVVRSC